MNKTVIAIPSNLPGGLKAEMSNHFGHCDLYTLVEIENGQIISVSTLDAVPHQEGGCLTAVQHLAAHGVNILLAGGMGMRPLMGFQEQGIQVFLAKDLPSVEVAVQAFCQNNLPLFTVDHTCKGHHSHF